MKSYDRAVEFLETCNDVFAPLTELAFDGNFSRLQSFNPEAFQGHAYRTLQGLLGQAGFERAAAGEMWRLEVGDFVLPYHWQPSSSVAKLSFDILAADRRDAITVSQLLETRRVGSGAGVVIDEPCWFWISPVRFAPMFVWVTGRQGDTGQTAGTDHG